MNHIDEQDVQPLVDRDKRLADARALVAAIENGDDANEARLVGDLTAGYSGTIFDEVGRMTREVHDTLRSFAEDERLGVLAEDEMPGARDRLHYVITLTEQAASRTLSITEEATPVAEQVVERSRRLKAELAKVAASEADNPRLRSVVDSITHYLEATTGSGERLKQQLTEVMMAQEFQDLSGQLLMRVIDLLEQLEEKLVGLLQITAPVRGSRVDGRAAERAEEGVGPQLPNAGDNVVRNQDDVDDLLASLGF
ncbi:MAG: protein phosphatase CheZ [Halothiobacillaceae bacterium]|nr:protein phosphatase CheZ [Halothiobacillaceae bacterium]HER34913.1 protein phosphatase CheZ [Halothiobacillaceae bacterium]